VDLQFADIHENFAGPPLTLKNYSLTDSVDTDMKEIKAVFREPNPVLSCPANFDVGKPPAELMKHQFSRSHISVTQVG
jgi:hypothetical protein